MPRLWTSLSLLILPFLLSHSVHASTHWQFDSDKEGISVYWREHKQGLVEIRARMFTPTSYSAFLRLLEDTDNVPSWVDNVSHSEVLEQISANENIVYTQFKAPWPARDRDMVTYSKYWQDELGLILHIQDAPDSAMAEQAGYIRIREVDARWTLQKINDGTTMIEYRAYANPGGALPNWLVNKLAKSSARKTFEGLRQQLADYQGLTHPGINE